MIGVPNLPASDPKLLIVNVDPVSLSGVQVNIDYSMTISSGRLAGHIVQRLRSPSVYSLQIPIFVIDPHRGLVPALAWVKSSGQAVSTRVDKKTVTRAAGRKPAHSSHLLTMPFFWLPRRLNLRAR